MVAKKIEEIEYKKECKCKHKGPVDYSIPVKPMNYKRR